ncbi:MAG: hypothetical protein HY866_21865 [Chloroflexi bacterium]|nr:hypothetical protein [Chloroflexota bacterium]
MEHIDYAAIEQAAQQLIINGQEAIQQKLLTVHAMRFMAANTWKGKGAAKFLTWVDDHALHEGHYFVNELEEYAATLRKAMQDVQAHDENWAARIRAVLSEE